MSLRRIPKPGGQDGELQDDWLDCYHLQESEKEVPEPIRMKQVQISHGYVQRERSTHSNGDIVVKFYTKFLYFTSKQLHVYKTAPSLNTSFKSVLSGLHDSILYS